MLHSTTMQTQALIENSNRLLQKTAASLANLPGGASSANAVAAAALNRPMLTATGLTGQPGLTSQPGLALSGTPRQVLVLPGISAAAAPPATTTFVVVTGNSQPQMIPHTPGTDAIVQATVEDVQGTRHRVQCPASAISTGGEQGAYTHVSFCLGNAGLAATLCARVIAACQPEAD